MGAFNNYVDQILIRGESNFDDKKVFNWSEVHLSEVTYYKIHTLIFFVLIKSEVMMFL